MLIESISTPKKTIFVHGSFTFFHFIWKPSFGLNSILFDQSLLHKYNIIEVGSGKFSQQTDD